MLNTDIAVREQYPLKLGFGLTIHKAQGMTLSRFERLLNLQPVKTIISLYFEVISFLYDKWNDPNLHWLLFI